MSEPVPSPAREGELSKSLWSVTWPLLLSLALSFSLYFADSFFLSRISDRAAASAGALFPLLGATLVVFTAVGQAGASVASQFIGGGHRDQLPLTYLALVLFNLALGLVTSLVFFSLHSLLPAWLGLEGGMRTDAGAYLAILGGFQFLKATQIAYGNIVTSRGQTQWMLAEAVLTNLSNIALNLLFLHGALGMDRLGVERVAIATVLSLTIGLGFTMTVVHLRLKIRFPPPRAIAWATLSRHLRQVLRIGLPSALEPLSYQASQLVINTIIVAWGARHLAARTYVFNFVVISSVLWGVAFGVGTQILIAHRVGAARFAEANQQMVRGLTYAISGNFVLSATLALAHRPLLSLLTTDPEIHRLASPLFYLGILVEPCRAVNIVTGGALRSSGDARYTALVGMLMMWTIGVPSCYLLGRWLEFGLSGIWAGLAIDELTRGLVNYRRWRTGRWQEFRVNPHSVRSETVSRSTS